MGRNGGAAVGKEACQQPPAPLRSSERVAGKLPKEPSFQFYPGDWLKDANLTLCSPSARSLWIDLLCIMWDCEQRGVLATDGERWTDEQIATAVRGDTYQNLLALQELLRHHVAKKDEQGRIYSKRMVEDERMRSQWRYRQEKHRVTHNVTPMSRPSSSSSSSSNLKREEPISEQQEEWRKSVLAKIEAAERKSKAKTA